jgi:hypothetical protein
MKKGEDEMKGKVAKEMTKYLTSSKSMVHDRTNERWKVRK